MSQKRPSTNAALSFVNRENIVKEVAFKLAFNAKQPILPPDNSNRQLIVLCNFFGFGKTRFTQEFLKRLNIHKKCSDFYDSSHTKAEYEEEIEKISRMKLFEVPCDKITYPDQKITMDLMKATFYDYSIGLLAQFKRIETLEHNFLDSTGIKKEIEKIDEELDAKEQRKSEFDVNIQNLAYFLKSNRILLFLDEISVLATKLQIQGTLLEKMYHVWKEILAPFVSYGGLICAGKGIFLKALGEGRLTSINQRSPTKVFHPQFKGFQPGNMKQLMKETEFLQPIHDYLEKTKLLDSFITNLSEKTGGIPIFFEYVLRQFASKYKVFRAISSMQEKREFLKKIIAVGDNFPERAEKFFKNADEIYQVLHAYGLFLAAFEIEIEEGESVSLPQSIISTRFSEYEWKNIKIEDIVNQLDCYFVDTGKNVDKNKKKMKIVFPPMIVEKRLQDLELQSEPLIPFFSHVIKTGLKDITDDGKLLEYMVNDILTWKINFQMFGTNPKNFGEIFPFLRDSFVGNMKLTQKIPETAFNIPKLVETYRFKKDLKEKNRERKEKELGNIQMIIKACQRNRISHVHVDNWYALLEHCPENHILKPAPMSHSADSLLVVKKYKNILLFQDKNTKLKVSALIKDIMKVNVILSVIEKVKEDIKQKTEEKNKIQQEIELKCSLIKEKQNTIVRDLPKIQEKQKEIDQLQKEIVDAEKNSKDIQYEINILSARQKISKEFGDLKLTLVVVALKLGKSLQEKMDKNGKALHIQSNDCKTFFDPKIVTFSQNLEVVILSRDELAGFLHKVNVEILEKYSKEKNTQNFGATAQKVIESLEHTLPKTQKTGLYFFFFESDFQIYNNHQTILFILKF